MTVGAVPDYVKMQAAVFTDGATAGPPEKVGVILERRKAMIATVHELMSWNNLGGSQLAAGDLLTVYTRP